MKRDLVVSAVIAAAIHGGLLFGVRSSHAAVVQDKVIDDGGPPVCPDAEPVELIPVLEGTSFEWGEPRGPVFERPRSIALAEKFEIEVEGGIAETWIRPDPIACCPDFFTVTYPGRAGSVEVSELDHIPLARLKTRPAYPFAARRTGLSGEVMIEFEVDEAGVVHAPQVVHSTDRRFDDPALLAVAQWRFEPGKKDGRAVRFRMAVPIVFSLNND